MDDKYKQIIINIYNDGSVESTGFIDNGEEMSNSVKLQYLESVGHMASRQLDAITTSDVVNESLSKSIVMKYLDSLASKEDIEKIITLLEGKKSKVTKLQ